MIEIQNFFSALQQLGLRKETIHLLESRATPNKFNKNLHWSNPHLSTTSPTSDPSTTATTTRSAFVDALSRMLAETIARPSPLLFTSDLPGGSVGLELEDAIVRMQTHQYTDDDTNNDNMNTLAADNTDAFDSKQAGKHKQTGGEAVGGKKKAGAGKQLEIIRFATAEERQAMKQSSSSLTPVVDAQTQLQHELDAYTRLRRPRTILLIGTDRDCAHTQSTQTSMVTQLAYLRQFSDHRNADIEHGVNAIDNKKDRKVLVVPAQAHAHTHTSPSTQTGGTNAQTHANPQLHEAAESVLHPRLHSDINAEISANKEYVPNVAVYTAATASKQTNTQTSTQTNTPTTTQTTTQALDIAAHITHCRSAISHALEHNYHAVIIDSTGIDLQSPAAVQHLHTLYDAILPDEVIAVIDAVSSGSAASASASSSSSTSSAETIADTVHTLEQALLTGTTTATTTTTSNDNKKKKSSVQTATVEVGPKLWTITGLILGKVEQTTGDKLMESLLELPEQVKTPIRYLLKGRKVTDMEVFEADKVVDALLGEDKHSDVNTNVELTAKDKRVSNFCMLVLP
jgi:hypothetical protein